jgi:predicted transcriptional regulator
MTLHEVVEQLGLKVCCGAEHLEREVAGGYAGDLLSDVVANSQAGDLWITLQAHENAIAVASLRDLAGIVFVGGREPDEETTQRANERGVPLLSSSLRTFDLIVRLLEAGVPSR